jgi:8-oxo-dGTP diphosphatase
MTDYHYIVNVEGAVVRDDEFLLIERSAEEDHAAGLLGFPGGKLEASPGNTGVVAETARREVDEEIGVEVGAVHFVESATFESDSGAQCVNIVTHCEYESGEPHPKAEEEVAAVHWLTLEEIRDHEDAPAYIENYAEAVAAFRETEL